ncbi:MAG: hypothetical protein ACI9DC_001731 [Gammaproteobacteria bacterium]|jgi:hypothetical protein
MLDVRLVHLFGGLGENSHLQIRECEVSRLQSAMVGMSHGERILAAFFLAVWLGAEEGQHFNLMEAAAVLDASAFAVVREWVNDPFFP